MTCLELCILVVTIGAAMLVVGCGIVSKIYEEGRRNAAVATAEISKWITECGNVVVNTCKGVNEAEATRRAEFRKKNYENYPVD